MSEPTLKELAARVVMLEEQIVSLTEMLAEEDDSEAEDVDLETQHIAFRARLKEKRRCG